MQSGLCASFILSGAAEGLFEPTEYLDPDLRYILRESCGLGSCHVSHLRQDIEKCYRLLKAVSTEAKMFELDSESTGIAGLLV